MGIVAGILLALAAVLVVAGFHLGHHAHLAAAALGGLAALALIALLAGGGHPGWVWAVLAGDVALSSAVGLIGWRGVAGSRHALPAHPPGAGSGDQGVALSDLDPDGIVKVRGEQWSAVAVNAPVTKGSAVQVVGRGGVRLRVWGLGHVPVEEEDRWSSSS